MPAIILMMAVTLILGCAATPEPFVYHDDRDTQPGPGLFSKEKGAIIIYSNEEKMKDDQTSSIDNPTSKKE